MLSKRIIQSLLLATAILTASMPGQAAMVGTAQLQQSAAAAEFDSIVSQREWLREQLVIGGIDAGSATERVAAMTDTQVREIYQRIDDAPAGAGVGEVLLVALIVLLVLEVTGYTDFIKD